MSLDLGDAYRTLELNPDGLPDGDLPAHPLRDAIMQPPGAAARIGIKRSASE